MVLILLVLTTHFANAQCDPAIRPVIFVHGFLASGDTWSNAVHFFSQAGYCNDQLYAFDWNSVGGGGKTNEQALVKLIDKVLIQTGAQQVDLVGHSAGGGLIRGLLNDSVQAQKVRRYVHIGSRKWTTSHDWFTNEKCMNIFSAADRVAGNGAGPVEGATNVSLTTEDHYQVATSPRALAAMLSFLHPISSTRQPTANNSAKVSISGRAVLLGDNAPMKDASVTIYAIDKKTGVRKKNPAALQTKTTVSGQWGPLTVSSGLPYEIELASDDTAKRKISYYFTSFDHTDPLVYLRGIPEGSRMSALLGKIPAEQDQSALVVYSATAAMIGGRDSVAINNIAISAGELMPASRTIITSFIFDDGDAVSSVKSLQQYRSTPFIGGVDLLLSAGPKKVISIYFNGKTLNLPARPSAERIMLAVVR
ncbi:MAG: alpha/beta fold hydrolase [Sphingomonadales bacterium]